MTEDRRVRRNVESLQALHRFLECLVANPTSYSDESKLLLASLASQGALSKYANEELRIHPTSINTMKRLAEVAIAGGFPALDELRKKAIEALYASQRTEDTPRKKRKADLEQDLEDLADKYRLLYEDLERLTRAFKKSLEGGRNYARAANSPTTIELCKREQRALLAELSLMRTPVKNVIDLPGA